MPSKYDEQTRVKAVRLVQDHRDDYALGVGSDQDGVGPAGDER